jgi:hypothetical protein
MDSKAVLVCICSLLNRDFCSFPSISAIFVTGKILKLINYHEKQNSFGGNFTAGDINYYCMGG